MNKIIPVLAVAIVLISSFAVIETYATHDKETVKVEPDTGDNFASNGKFYYNIGNKIVTVDSFVRWPGQTTKNPSFGEAVLLNQCIEYKKTHPDEEVYMTCTSFHFSIVAAACVDYDNESFGLMKSLYDCTQDGTYIRVSELLFEAAKIGIHVIVIGQIDASPVDCGSDIPFADYFNSRQGESCYDLDYIPDGSIVSDFMCFHEAKWTSYDDESARSAADMMHLKSASVSAYLGKDGKEHGKSIWLSSTNLDGITSSGSNGNDGVQTGVIISDHDGLYDTIYNFTNMMKDYCEQEDITIFRDKIIKMTNDQIDLIESGKMKDIQDNQRIVYLGNEQDSVFKLYLTPIGGFNNIWDEKHNPLCKNIIELYNSHENLDVVWVSAKYKPNFEMGLEYLEMIREAYLNSTSTGNKLFLQLPGVDSDLDRKSVV